MLLPPSHCVSTSYVGPCSVPSDGQYDSGCDGEIWRYKSMILKCRE